MNKIFIFIISAILLTSCGEPNSPEDYSGGYNIIKRLNTPGASNDVIVDQGVCYVSQGESGLLIINVADPKNPQIVKHFYEEIRGYSNKIIKKNSIIYMAANTFGVSVIDVTNSSLPLLIDSNLNIKPAKNLHVIDDFLITAISERGFNISNISIPSSLDIRETTTTNGYVKDVATTIDKSKLFVATGEVGLSVFDISFFNNGYGTYPLLSTLNLNGYAEDLELLDDSNIAFIACGNAGLQIVDYSNPVNLKLVGNLNIGGYAKELTYKDGKIFMAVGFGGLQIIDVQNFTSPKLLGIVDTNNATGITVVGQYIYVADKEEGLIIISKN